jgi:hypothetical protein
MKMERVREILGAKSEGDGCAGVVEVPVAFLPAASAFESSCTMVLASCLGGVLFLRPLLWTYGMGCKFASTLAVSFGAGAGSRLVVVGKMAAKAHLGYMGADVWVLAKRCRAVA